MNLKKFKIKIIYLLATLSLFTGPGGFPSEEIESDEAVGLEEDLSYHSKRQKKIDSSEINQEEALLKNASLFNPFLDPLDRFAWSSVSRKINNLEKAQFEHFSKDVHTLLIRYNPLVTKSRFFKECSSFDFQKKAPQDCSFILENNSLHLSKKEIEQIIPTLSSKIPTLSSFILQHKVVTTLRLNSLLLKLKQIPSLSLKEIHLTLDQSHYSRQSASTLSNLKLVNSGTQTHIKIKTDRCHEYSSENLLPQL